MVRNLRCSDTRLNASNKVVGRYNVEFVAMRMGVLWLLEVEKGV